MPELAEVETVKETLKKQILNKKIKECIVLYNKIIDFPSLETFKNEITSKTIFDIKRRGKWLLFELNDYYLLSHLRMEGKYFIKNKDDEIKKHEHVIFRFTDDTELRYHDTRKFGKMLLVRKEEINNCKVIKELGLEPWDEKLTVDYLKKHYKKKLLPIKTTILDQSIIAGLGNIYADEVLFMSNINPLKKTSTLNNKDLEAIIINSRKVLEKAIKLGGTTIRSYTSSEGVHGRFQNELLVHGKVKSPCPTCQQEIIKISVGGRGTYYCPNCQK